MTRASSELDRMGSSAPQPRVRRGELRPMWAARSSWRAGYSAGATTAA